MKDFFPPVGVFFAAFLLCLATPRPTQSIGYAGFAGALIRPLLGTAVRGLGRQALRGTARGLATRGASRSVVGKAISGQFRKVRRGYNLLSLVYDVANADVFESFPGGVSVDEPIYLKEVDEWIEFNPKFFQLIDQELNPISGLSLAFEETCSGNSCHLPPDHLHEIGDDFGDIICNYVVFSGASLGRNVSRMAICPSIRRFRAGGGEPTCPPTSSFRMVELDRLYAFTELSNLSWWGNTVYYDWYRNGQRTDRIQVRVPSGQRYRNWTYKENGLLPGDWRVDVVHRGDTIASYAFEILRR